MLGKIFSRSRRSAEVEDLQNRLNLLQKDYDELQEKYDSLLDTYNETVKICTEEEEKAKNDSELKKKLNDFAVEFVLCSFSNISELKILKNKINVDECNDSPEFEENFADVMQKMGEVKFQTKMLKMIKKHFAQYLNNKL